MKWKAYPIYCDSGIERMGTIPTHWRRLVLKRLGKFQSGSGFPEDLQGIEGEAIPFYKVSDMNLVGNEVYMHSCQNTISHDTAASLRASIFPIHTAIFPKVGAALLLNKRRILTRPSCIDNNIMGFIPQHCDYKWAHYWLSVLNMSELVNPGAVPSVNESQLRELAATVPPISEQHAIASFLDRETSRIDSLIAKKQRQIEILQEKRAAIISHVVTKGLNPDARMKDSGVESMLLN